MPRNDHTNTELWEDRWQEVKRHMGYRYKDCTSHSNALESEAMGQKRKRTDGGHKEHMNGAQGALIGRAQGWRTSKLLPIPLIIVVFTGLVFLVGVT